jgi:hypothetical protein
MKVGLLIMMVFVLSQTLHSQALTKGLIIPKEGNSLDFGQVYIPWSGINIYNEPNGEIVGKIMRDSSSSTQNKSQKVFLVMQDHWMPLGNSNVKIIGDEITALVYIDQHSDFVKMENGYWISVRELGVRGLSVVNWMQYLIGNSPNVIGYYARNPGLDLRENPSEKSALILSLKGDLLEIKLTEETKGFWCKVIVTKYSEHPCTSKGNFDEIKLKTFDGWIKLLSDDQTPNVSYYKSC